MLLLPDSYDIHFGYRLQNIIQSKEQSPARTGRSNGTSLRRGLLLQADPVGG